MKGISKGTAIILFTMVFANDAMAQEDKKIDKAVDHFCKTVGNFIGAVNALEDLSMDASYNEYKKKYNKAVKDWDKVVKAADNLENVEINESVKAYNNLVDAVNNVEGDTASEKEANNINDNIDKTADALTSIMTATCQ